MSEIGNDSVRRQRAAMHVDIISTRETLQCDAYTDFDGALDDAIADALEDSYLAGAEEEAARAAAKLRAAAESTRTPFGEQLRRLADEIEEGS